MRSNDKRRGDRFFRVAPAGDQVQIYLVERSEMFVLPAKLGKRRKRILAREFKKLSERREAPGLRRWVGTQLRHTAKLVAPLAGVCDVRYSRTSGHPLGSPVGG